MEKTHGKHEFLLIFVSQKFPCAFPCIAHKGNEQQSEGRLREKTKIAENRTHKNALMVID